MLENLVYEAARRHYCNALLPTIEPDVIRAFLEYRDWRRNNNLHHKLWDVKANEKLSRKAGNQ